MRRGFTLIEILVVIAIIAILAAILFPVFSRARAKARQANCLSNLRQLGTAIEMYTTDYDERYPGAPNGNGGSGQYGGWVWYAQFGQPGPGYFDVTRGGLYPYTKNAQIYSCPDDRSGSGCSYELNGWLRWQSIAIVPKPSETLLLIPEDDHGTANDGYFDVPAGDWPRRNHNDGLTAAFVDGHVKWQNLDREQTHEACWPQ
jgi:prepilin-type N-terminal cleavage/methylation domain-containing protein/prepilin-type processing-associated H-X9-DG protein